MPKITDFPGFEIHSVKRFGTTLADSEEGFNPFREDIDCTNVKPSLQTVKPSSIGVTQVEKPVSIEAPPVPIASAEQKVVVSSVPLEESTPFAMLVSPKASAPVVEAPVPMIQPRTKEGQRLLYRYPHCPKVGEKGSYSMLVGQSDKSATAWLVQFDGGANPNPGPTSAGAVLWTPLGPDGKRSVAFEAGKFCGKATNNIGEAQGLLLGLQIAATRGARELLIEGDSELIVFHQTGQYKVSNANLKRWWAEIQAAMMDESCFDWIAIRQVPRELNERADSITKEVLTRKSSFQRA